MGEWSKTIQMLDREIEHLQELAETDLGTIEHSMMVYDMLLHYIELRLKVIQAASQSVV